MSGRITLTWKCSSDNQDDTEWEKWQNGEYTELALFTVNENSPSEWTLKLRRKQCFSHGPVEGSDLGIRINGGVGIRPNWAPGTSCHTMRQHKDGIQFSRDRGGISLDRQQRHKCNKVNRSDKFDCGDNKPSVLKQTTRSGTPGLTLNWH